MKTKIKEEFYKTLNAGFRFIGRAELSPKARSYFTELFIRATGVVMREDYPEHTELIKTLANLESAKFDLEEAQKALEEQMK